MISTIYRVSVIIPDDVHNYITQESLEIVWGAVVSVAFKDNTASGQDSYARVVEWAEFSTMGAAQRGELKLTEAIEQLKQHMDSPPQQS